MSKTFAKFGSISHGTMRPEDLIPSFVWELRRLAKRAGRVREFAPLIKDAENTSEEDAPDILDELFTALEEFAPPYGYFGAHEGDGSDYGFWLYRHALDEFDGLKVSDTSEVPRGYSGEVMHVNDHGNATLYNYVRGRAYEVWSIV